MSISRRTTLISSIAFCFLIFVTFTTYVYRPHLPSRLLSASINHNSFDGVWNFERDAENLQLSTSQCGAAFPELFKEVNRAVQHRRNNHITVKDIDDMRRSNGFIRAMIFDQKLYILESQGTFFTREYATIQAIHRALLTSPEKLPNIEFAFLTDDVVEHMPIWAYSRKESGEEIWLMPDFGYWSWPETKIGSYSEAQLKATLQESRTPWSKKEPKIVWRGALTTLPVRASLLNATQNKTWADVQEIKWASIDSLLNTKLTMDQHCRYKYLAHTEGTSNSGRLKYLQNCRSVLIVHELRWIQHHHHLMVSGGPDQNIVTVDREWKQLEGAIEALIADDKRAEQIADNGIKMFKERYLTSAAETCYWRALMRGWREVSFEPQFYNGTRADGVPRMRGVPVESFLLMRQMEWGRVKSDH